MPVQRAASHTGAQHLSLGISLQIANNRYSFFGKRDVCQLRPDNQQHADRFLA